MLDSVPRPCHDQQASTALRIWDVDPATTDAERAAWDVPPLAEQIRKAEEATRIDPPGPVNLDDAPWWLKEALVRWG